MNTTSIQSNAKSSAVSHALDATERARLAELEPVIERGMASFVEVGTALVEISDRRLYRETHSTFQEYCQEKWNISARRAYQLCEAAEVVKALPENVNHGSQINERRARELAKVDPERRVEVLEAAASKGKVTASAIRCESKRIKNDLLKQIEAAIVMAPEWSLEADAPKLTFKCNGTEVNIPNTRENLGEYLRRLKSLSVSPTGRTNGTKRWLTCGPPGRGKMLVEMLKEKTFVLLPISKREVRDLFEKWITSDNIEEPAQKPTLGYSDRLREADRVMNAIVNDPLWPKSEPEIELGPVREQLESIDRAMYQMRARLGGMFAKRKGKQ